MITTTAWNLRQGDTIKLLDKSAPVMVVKTERREDGSTLVYYSMPGLSPIQSRRFGRDDRLEIVVSPVVSEYLQAFDSLFGRG